MADEDRETKPFKFVTGMYPLRPLVKLQLGTNR